MIALEVSLNGKKICLAGAEDLSVLSAHLTAAGMLGRKTPSARPKEGAPDLFYSVSGLSAPKVPGKKRDVWWRGITSMKIGDTLSIKLVEVTKADRPRDLPIPKPRKAPNQSSQPTPQKRRG